MLYAKSPSPLGRGGVGLLRLLEPADPETVAAVVAVFQADGATAEVQVVRVLVAP